MSPPKNEHGSGLVTRLHPRRGDSSEPYSHAGRKRRSSGDARSTTPASFASGAKLKAGSFGDPPAVNPTLPGLTFPGKSPGLAQYPAPNACPAGNAA